MRAVFRLHHSAALLFVVAGCADLTTLPRPAQAPHTMVREVVRGEPTGADPEWPVRIKDATFTLSFTPDERFKADSWMSYDGNYATVTYKIDLDGHTMNLPFYGVETLHFFDQVYTEHFDMGVPGLCGNVANGTATFKAALITFYGLPALKSVTRSETGEAAQPACHTDYTYASNGGSGGRTSYQICTTTQVDYYWYYPDTNTYEYRYSDSSTECNAMA